jgi:hypothetical protein
MFEDRMDLLPLRPRLKKKWYELQKACDFTNVRRMMARSSLAECPTGRTTH